MTIDFNALVNSVAMMFVYMVIGYIARKINMINDVSSKKLTDFILQIAQPFMIVNAIISNEYSAEGLVGGLTIMGVGLIVHAVAAGIAFVSVLWVKNKKEKSIMQDSMILANCGFFGFPLLEALFGAKGLFWGAFFVIMFNLVAWTYGIFILSRAEKSVQINPLKLILNYGTTPCLIGLTLYLLRVPAIMPTFLTTAIKGIAATSTPVTLIVAGSLIANIPVKKLLTTPKVYYSCLVKLVVVPLVSALVLKLIGFDRDFVIFGTIMASLPTAAVVAMFAEKYDIDPDLAAHNVGMTTLLTVATIPAVVWVAGLFI